MQSLRLLAYSGCAMLLLLFGSWRLLNSTAPTGLQASKVRARLTLQPGVQCSNCQQPQGALRQVLTPFWVTNGTQTLTKSASAGYNSAGRSSGSTNSSSITSRENKNTRSESSVCLFVGVLSAPGNVEARKAIRETWGSDPRLVRLMFFVQRPHQDTAFKQVREEAVATGDMVVSSEIYADYYNITYSVLQIFRSAALLGDAISHVVKTDDDVYVRWSLLLPALEAMPQQWLYAGAPMVAQSVVRSPGWHQVSYKNWPRDDPVRYRFGWGYVVSMDIAQHIAAGAPHMLMPGDNLLIIEDVAVGYWVEFIGKENNVTIGYRTIEHSENSSKCTSSAMFLHIKQKPQWQVIRCMYANDGECCSESSQSR